MRYSIGQAVPRTEDPRLLMGRGRFVDDFNIMHQTHAVVLRSPHAHAEIRSIDTSAAEKMPGVLAVLTGEDYADAGLGQIPGPSPFKKRDGSPMFRPYRPPLTKDRVRYVGQPVALIVADTIAQAKDAAEAVMVEYDPLPANTSTEKANQGAPQIWDEAPNNESYYVDLGNAEATEAAIASAPHVVRQKFVVNRITANTMEPRGALGVYDEGQDRYTIHTGVQRPFAWRQVLSNALFHINENQLSFVTGDMGGSFGMKGSIFPEIPLVAWASKRVGRPVKWVCERAEAHIADDHARDNVTEAELALDDDGKFLGFRVTTTASLGAYLSYLGANPPVGNTGGLAGLYTTPAINVRVTGVFTNNNPTSPYRGAGRPEASYIIERMVNLAARELGLAPEEIRRRNFIPPSAMPYKTALTFTYDSGEFEALMDETLAMADYAGFEARRAASKARGKLRGVGISTAIEQAAGPQSETAEIRFDPSGTCTVLVGSTPHGQGHETIYKQLVSERLGLEVEDIRVIEGDTDKVSFGVGTGGSRTATIGTSAVLMGVEKVTEKGRRIAAHMLEAAESDIEMVDGEYRVAGTDRSVSFKDVAKAAFQPASLPKGFEQGMYEIATYQPDKANFPNGCHVVEVEIDPDTGELEIDRYTVIDDVGFELNPLLVAGQLHGGIVQGAGQAMMENMQYDESGQLLTGSFMDYAMPRADDFCSFAIGSHPVPTDQNPLGVKGVGESGTVGALAGVMNAINDALAPLGVRHLEMPATPEKVWRAIRDAQG